MPCVYIYIYVYTYVHTYIYIYIYTHTHTTYMGFCVVCVTTMLSPFPSIERAGPITIIMSKYYYECLLLLYECYYEFIGNYTIDTLFTVILVLVSLLL